MARRPTTILILALACVGLVPIVANQARGLTTVQYWQRAQESDYKSPEELQAQHDRELRKGQNYSKLMRGDPNVKAVALTFDDGPHPAFTPRILAILKQHNIKATFFVVGKMAQQYPNLVRAESLAGNVVGNHTYDHVNLTKIPDSMVDVEWKKDSDVIQSILGIRPTFCRPPGGDYDKSVIQSAMKQGLTTVLWTDDPGDYAKPGDKAIEQRVLDRMDNGGIILIHDGIQQTIDVLPQIIERLEQRGFKFVTVAQMIQNHAEATPAPPAASVGKEPVLLPRKHADRVSAATETCWLAWS